MTTLFVPVTPAGLRRSARTGERIAVAVLLLGTGALYLIGDDVSHWGNTYYAAAAQAGAESWKAFLYGASDAPASITVDKPPASIWLMALSVRLFGLSYVSVLLPQALLGVATVSLVYATVRRIIGFPLALAAGAAVAVMPASTLMFRYDNPDALLAALLAVAGYAAVRSLEAARVRWMVLLGAALGAAFLTKQLQAFLVLPGMVVGFLMAAPVSFGRRVLVLLAAAGALVVTAGWWVLLVELTPATDRPWIGGSKTNSFLELTFGYNGFGRLVGGGGNGVLSGPDSTLLRLLGGTNAFAIGWLLPAAFVLGLAAIPATRARGRTDMARGALIMSWLGLLVSSLAFSVMAGIYHSYYTIALVPALAVTLALAARELWRERARSWCRVVLAGSVATSALWAIALLWPAPDSFTPLRCAIVLGGLAASVLIARPASDTLMRATATVAIVALLLGPMAQSIATARLPHAGSGPSTGAYRAAPLPDRLVDPRIVDVLRSDSSSFDWVAAVTGSKPASDLQLATGLPVMPIGGYKRTDPSPTLAQFQADVRQGRVHWFIWGTSNEISRWVAAHFLEVDVAGERLYDLTRPSAGTAAVSPQSGV